MYWQLIFDSMYAIFPFVRKSIKGEVCFCNDNVCSWIRTKYLLQRLVHFPHVAVIRKDQDSFE
jgi:hypothetical protein